MKRTGTKSQNSNLTIGLIILIIGSVLLLRKLGIFIPGWIITWPMILIAVGLVTLIKHNFQSGFGAFMVLFGSFWLIKRELHIPMIEPFLIPVGLIALGLYIILNQKNKRYDSDFFNFQKTSVPPNNPGFKDTASENMQGNEGYKSYSGGFINDGGDVINSQAFFSGHQKRVLSKNFKGGKASAIFGGTEIDFTQADLAENAVLNVEVAFGGLKLIVPPHWDLQINVTNVFAGVEDKRMYPQTVPDTAKVLKIYGTVILGGIDIKSY